MTVVGDSVSSAVVICAVVVVVAMVVVTSRHCRIPTVTYEQKGRMI